MSLPAVPPPPPMPAANIPAYAQVDKLYMKPERGKIVTVAKQTIKNQDYTPQRIEVPFLFNPTELTVSMTNSWNTPDSGKNSNNKAMEFGGGQPRTITLDLFFDTYELHHNQQLTGRQRDVRQYTDRLMQMMKVQDQLGPPDHKWPPQVQVEWGILKKGWNFRCYITSMTQKFLLFARDGTPVRATVNLTLQQADDDYLGPQNPTSGGVGSERTRLVQPGERLDWIAYQEYGDSTLWRLIADANGLFSTRDLTVGQRLAIPPRR